MSTYGDRGNIICLEKRCQWRGIRLNVVPIGLETRNEKLVTSDLLFMGGAQDRQQKLVAKDLLQYKGPIILQMIERGIPGLFVCAAYQFMGKFYQPYQGKKIPGLGLFDLYTEHPGDQKKRLIGNVVVEVQSSHLRQGYGGQAKFKVPRQRWVRLWRKSSGKEDFKSTLVGFENHGGRTYLGNDVKPLGEVIKGFGNNGEDGTEGAIYKNAVGSYFHGPILPKNPHLADWLIVKALEVKYGKSFKLEPLDDSLEWRAHEKAIRIASKRFF